MSTTHEVQAADAQEDQNDDPDGDDDDEQPDERGNDNSSHEMLLLAAHTAINEFPPDACSENTVTTRHVALQANSSGSSIHGVSVLSESENGAVGTSPALHFLLSSPSAHAGQATAFEMDPTPPLVTTTVDIIDRPIPDDREGTASDPGIAMVPASVPSAGWLSENLRQLGENVDAFFTHLASLGVGSEERGSSLGLATWFVITAGVALEIAVLSREYLQTRDGTNRGNRLDRPGTGDR